MIKVNVKQIKKENLYFHWRWILSTYQDATASIDESGLNWQNERGRLSPIWLHSLDTDYKILRQKGNYDNETNTRWKRIIILELYGNIT